MGEPASWSWLRASAAGGSQGPLLPASFPIISYGGRTLIEAHAPNSVNPITSTHPLPCSPSCQEESRDKELHLCFCGAGVLLHKPGLQLPRSLAQVGMNWGQSSYLVAGLVLLKQGLT